MSRIRERLTYANLMASVAVFIALGAGAYAAGLGKNSVKSKQIKAGAVKNAELADDAVTAPKVANGSLRSEDFAPGQIPQGPRGEQGLRGERGLPGAGAFILTRRISGLVNVPADGSVEGSKECDPGERSTGGGFALWNGLPADFHVVSSGPSTGGGDNETDGTPTGWAVRGRNVDVNNSNDVALDFRVYVICAGP